MNTTPLRIGFIGSGQMARQHLHVVGRRPEAIVVGVYDRASGPAAEFAALAGTRPYPSVAALMADAQPDVVHVCTPPAAHFDGAYAALEGGAHVYVEKPFALTMRDARALLDLADVRRLTVCAGHQLLHDPAFETLMARGAALGTIVQADSHFAFRPLQERVARAGARALADQAVDILPHPLYTLIAALERCGASRSAIELAWAQAGPADLHATLRAGDVVGRLSVSLRARPIASTLTLIGTGGALTADFVRSIVVGAANAGTEALEKVFNPMVEGAQLVSRTAGSLARRLRTGIAYPGLRELIGAFHDAVAAGAASPVPPEHLLLVTEIFEQLVAELRKAALRSTTVAAPAPAIRMAPVTVVTGASGFLGSEIARALPRVRGVSRVPNPDDPHVHEWIAADLNAGVPPDAFANADVVVHAAAETVGSYEAHQRNTIDATRNLLRAMHAAGVKRLVLVSSLSVLRPPLTRREHQDERTPQPADPRAFGSYVWGKCLQEQLVEREAPALGIATRIVRPGALLDPRAPGLPGLMGRKLYDRWHLALGRRGLPIAVCDVARCAEAIAWCVTHFDEAPPVVNLFDPAATTRGDLIDLLRTRGWRGRIVWIPVWAIAPVFLAARAILSVIHGAPPERLATWLTYVQPRSYDPRLSSAILSAVDQARADRNADVALPA